MRFHKVFPVIAPSLQHYAPGANAAKEVDYDATRRKLLAALPYGVTDITHPPGVFEWMDVWGIGIGASAYPAFASCGRFRVGGAQKGSAGSSFGLANRNEAGADAPASAPATHREGKSHRAKRIEKRSEREDEIS